jgi:hypothetical protein
MFWMYWRKKAIAVSEMTVAETKCDDCGMERGRDAREVEQSTDLQVLVTFWKGN